MGLTPKPDDSTGQTWPGSQWWYDNRYHGRNTAFLEVFEPVELITASL
jgi:hypothetical protein